MKHRASTAASLLACLSLWSGVALAESSPRQNEKPVEVRGLRFGAREAEIRRTEKAKYVAEEDVGAEKVLLYSDSLLSSPVFVRYRLVKDSLYEIGYSFRSPGGCPRSLELFGKIQDELAAKYGEPESKDVVGRRKCIKMTKWDNKGETGAATIAITLDGNNHASKLDVFYHDASQKDAVSQARKESDKGKL